MVFSAVVNSSEQGNMVALCPEPFSGGWKWSQRVPKIIWCKHLILQVRKWKHQEVKEIALCHSRLVAESGL